MFANAKNIVTDKLSKWKRSFQYTSIHTIVNQLLKQLPIIHFIKGFAVVSETRKHVASSTSIVLNRLFNNSSTQSSRVVFPKPKLISITMVIV